MWRWDTVSHLSCDPGDDIETLHAFAIGIGLKRRWFQSSPGRMPHYDLCPSKRLQALERGANELKTRPEVVSLIRAWCGHQAAKTKHLDLAI